LFVCNFIFGLAQSLGGVTMAPFLMENSSEKERTYLFSFVSGFQMVSGSIGNWIGGYMPTWIAAARGVDPEHTTAYAGSLLIVAITGAVAVIPLLMLKSPKTTYSKRDAFTPLVYVKKYPKTLGRLILPILLTSIGAGLVMPFQNVFFKDVHHASDPLIGTIFAWGSLAMGIGLLIAPPLAARLGKIELVVITQGLSIPFLILLGFAPWLSISVIAYYVRVALMNMSTPVYQTFVMEQVEPEARATVATLNSMSWNFGWTFSPMISGVIQVSSGFGLPFLGTIVFYIIAVYLYWLFFWKGRSKPTSVALPEATTGD
jgi:MFS family permease